MLVQIALEAEIGHDGRDDAAAREAPARCHDSAISAMSWSPSMMWPFSSTMHDAVGVAVERDADIGAHLADLARIRRPARSSRTPG